MLVKASTMSQLLEDLRQRAFESPQQQVFINVLYTSAFVKKASSGALKPYGLTWQQFNAMRILRGQGDRPASMRLLQDRMLDPQSNASRLVDKLSAKGLVVRETSTHDRRRVGIALTPEGAGVLAQASAAMTDYLRTVGGGLSDQEMVQLSDLLDRFRLGLRRERSTQ